MGDDGIDASESVSLVQVAAGPQLEGALPLVRLVPGRDPTVCGPGRTDTPDQLLLGVAGTLPVSCDLGRSPGRGEGGGEPAVHVHGLARDQLPAGRLGEK